MLQTAAELTSLATVEAEYAVTAADTRALLPRLTADARQAALLARLLPRTRVFRRHVALPPDVLLDLHGVTERAEAYEHARLALGVEAARRALTAADVPAGAIGGVVAVSSTAYRVPSLDALLVRALGLDPAVRRLPMSELGCAAGVAGLGVSRALVQAGDAPILLVAVELCSLSIKTDQPSDSDAIGNVLFGDAAAAAVVGPGTRALGPEIVATASMLWPDTEDLLGMRLTDAGYELILSPALPSRVRTYLRETVYGFLAANGVSRDEIRFWAIHPGGPKVLEAVIEALDLTDADVAPTWRTWESNGNISSATVFFVLATLRDTAPPARDGLGVVLAFGPGVTCELLLLRARGWLAAA